MKKYLFFLLLISSLLYLNCSSLNTKHKDKYNYILHKGLERSFVVYRPSNLNTTNKYPLLIVLHGGHGTGNRMQDLTLGKFNTIADKENFVVIYPNGFKKNWNDGRINMPKSYAAHNQNIDDVGFIKALIEKAKEDYNIDEKRIYIAGMSNGAMMTHRLAIELSDKIAAAVPVCGNLPSDLKSIPKNRVPIMIINGTKDPLVPYNGGFVHFMKKKLGNISSTEESIQFWINNNGLKNTIFTNEFIDSDVSDFCTVNKTTFIVPDNNNEVIFVRIDGGGHTWPGGWQYLNEKIIGKTCRDIDACQLIWDFCKNHSK